MRKDYAAIPLSSGLASLRDLAPKNIDHILHYFYESNDPALDLVIDRDRLPQPEKMRRFFLNGIRNSSDHQPDYYLRYVFRNDLPGIVKLTDFG